MFTQWGLSVPLRWPNAEVVATGFSRGLIVFFLTSLGSSLFCLFLHDFRAFMFCFVLFFFSMASPFWESSHISEGEAGTV